MCYSVDVMQWEGITFSLVYFSVTKETSFAFHQFEQYCDDPSQWVISTLPKAECNAQSCFIFILTGNFIQLDGAMMTHLSGCNSASNCWMSTHFLCLPSWIFQSVRQRYADPSQWVMTLLLTTECPTTFMVLVETEDGMKHILYTLMFCVDWSLLLQWLIILLAEFVRACVQPFCCIYATSNLTRVIIAYNSLMYQSW
jgi:hypothetical protein